MSKRELTFEDLPKIKLINNPLEGDGFWSDSGNDPVPWVVDATLDRESIDGKDLHSFQLTIIVGGKKITPTNGCDVLVRGPRDEVLTEANEIGAALLWSALRAWALDSPFFHDGDSACD